MSALKRTPFYDIQKQRNARFVGFGAWELPVQYQSVLSEHQSVRERVGLFDVSHMGEVLIEGPEAFDACQYILTNDVAKLEDGKAQYTLMCKADGGIVDDLIIYRQAEDSYFLCINAARIDVDYDHLCTQAKRFDCTLRNVSEQYAQLALQGPKSLDVLAAISDFDFQSMKPFSWVDLILAGDLSVRVAATGYTGERGVELYCAPTIAEKLWMLIEESGLPHDLALCGLGARDTLRLEMCYALYGNDIDEQHNPLEGNLGWVVKLNKGDFLGRQILADVKEQGLSRKLVGFKMLTRGIPRHGYLITSEGKEIGVVTSGSHSPTLAEPIGLGYVPIEVAAEGATFDVMVRDKAVKAQVVATPFYKRG
jgi:aminomethyltransferase